MITYLLNATLARRLIDVIPEAFGFTFLAKMTPEVKLPSYFLARNTKNRWINIAFSRELIFTFALQVADKMLREGPRQKFEAISLRSSMVNTVNNALNQGANLAGALVGPPAFIGIPAEVYPPSEKSLLQKLTWWK